MTPTIIITNDDRPGSTRQWLRASIQTDKRLSFDVAQATIDQLARELADDGWQFAGSSAGWGRVPNTYTIEVHGMKGRGAPTAWELEMQSTVTGRD
jgi:hypothetical protein